MKKGFNDSIKTSKLPLFIVISLAAIALSMRIIIFLLSSDNSKLFLLYLIFFILKGINLLLLLYSVIKDEKYISIINCIL